MFQHPSTPLLRAATWERWGRRYRQLLQLPRFSFREAARPTLIALRWFLVALALLIGGAAVTLVA